MPNINISKQRSQIYKQIRNFFNKNDFTEVETPILVKIPGMEPHLTPFETTFINGKKLYLNTSPELQMKKLLGAGFGNIYQLTKVFRNGETGGPLHNPEFTMLEWYRENADYKKLMEDCENLIIELAKTMNSKTSDFEKPWPKKSINELFIEHCKINLLKNKKIKKFQTTAKNLNYNINGCHTWDDLFFKIFLNEVEPKLPKNKPIFVYDYPASQAALAKIKSGEPFFAERFELYINGIEIANAFSELIDAKEQRERLKSEQKLRKKLKKTVFDIDEEFLAGLESIKLPCAGIALGVDRLIMVLLNKKYIDDVLLFPLNKI